MLVGGVGFQRQTGRLHGCTVAGGVDRPQPPSFFIVEQIGEADTKRRRHSFDVAPCVTLQKPFALAMSSAERILPILMSWTLRRPAVA